LTAGAARRVEIVTSLPRIQTRIHHTDQPMQSILSTEKQPAVHQLHTDNSYSYVVGNNSSNKATATATTEDTYEHDAHDDSSTQHKAYTGSCSSVSSSVVSSSARQQSNAAKDDTATSQPAHTEQSAPNTVSDLKSTSNTGNTIAVGTTAARCAEADSSSVNTDTTATGLARDTESLPLPPLRVQQEFATLTNSSDAIIGGNVTPPQAMSNDDTTSTSRMRMSSDVAGNSGVQANDTDTATNTPQQHAHTNVNSSSTVVNAVPDNSATASTTSNRQAAVHSSDDMPVVAVHSDSLKCHTHASGAALQQSTLLPASAVVSPGKSDDTWPIQATNSGVQQQQQPQQQTTQQTNSQRLSRAMALAAGVLRMAQNHYQHTAATATATTDGSTAVASIANRCK
jgi:hypothetical protein